MFWNGISNPLPPPAPKARSIRGRQGSCERPLGLSWDAGKRVRAPSPALHLRRRRVQSEAGRAPAKGPGLSWDAGKRVRAPSGSRKAPAASTCAEGAFNPRPAGLPRKALGPFVGCREAGSSPVGVQRSTRCLRPADQAGARCCRRCIRDQLAKPYRSLKKNMIKHTRTET